MKRLATFLRLVALSAFVTVLRCNSSFAESHGGNCQDKLVGNSYDCTYKFFGGGNGFSFIDKSVCVTFVTGGLSQNFDWVGVLGSLASDYGCACQATGAFRSPSFDDSPHAFECVGDLVNVVQFHGRVESNKLNGQASEKDGTTIAFHCTQRPTVCFP